MAFCQECGNRLGDGAKFCGACGAPAPTHAHGPGQADDAVIAASRPEEPGKPSSGGATVARLAADVPSDMMDAPNLPGEFAMGAWTADPRAAFSGTASAPGAMGETAARAAGKGRRRLPVIAGALVAVAVIAAVALYVVPLFVPHPHDPHEDMANVPPVEQVKVEPEVKPKPDPEPEVVPQPTSDPKSDSEPDPDPTSDPKPEVEPQPTSHSTSDTPVIGEFSWFSNDMMNGNAPEGIARVTDVSAVLGGWKAYIYNYAIAGNEHSQPSEELLNVYVDAGQGGTTLTFDWYYARGGDGQAYENTQPNAEYVGAWTNGAIEAYGMGSVRLTDFWEQDGKQYAIGRIGWPDGVDASIALVRP